MKMLLTIQMNMFLIFILISLYQIHITNASNLTSQTDLQNNTISSLVQNTSTTAELSAGNGTINARQLPNAKLIEVKRLKTLFQGTLTPILCVLGIIGNIINLIVLTRKEMHSSTNCFLIALAVSDMLLLAVQIPRATVTTDKWKGMSREYIIASRYLGIIPYVIGNIFITSTSWLTVAITVERFIAISFALKVRFICTVRRAKVAIAAIFIISFLFHLSKCFEYTPNHDHTSPIPAFPQTLAKSEIYNKIMHVLNIGVAVFIPEVSLLILNSLLIYFYIQHNRSMRYIKDSGRQELLQLTLVVISMVSVFMMCHSVGLYLAINIGIYSRNILQDPKYITLAIINNFLVLVNSSVNFILYTAISKRFRENFIRVFQKCCSIVKRKKVLTPKSSTSLSNTKSTSSGRSYSLKTLT